MLHISIPGQIEMGKRYCFYNLSLSTRFLFLKHTDRQTDTHPLLYTVSLAQSSEGRIWYVTVSPKPWSQRCGTGILGHTYMDNSHLILASPVCLSPSPASPNLCTNHLLLFRPTSNLPGEGDQVMGPPS